MKRNMNMS